MPKNYWQIAAGSHGRDYSSTFIKYGIAFVGGDTQIETMKQVQLGDVVILKNGLYQILAAGEVVERSGKFSGCGDKAWLLDFDGWELPAYCYVNWHKPCEPFPTDGLTIATIQKLPQERHQKLADEILASPVCRFDDEPISTLSVPDNEILDILISHGLRTSVAEDLTHTLRRIRLLASYYYSKCQWGDIREHETRTFLVIPLLLSLGWSEQQLKIELPCTNGKIDIACFSKPYAGNNDDCVLIVETKDFSKGLDYDPDQAKKYAEGFSNCRGVLVTNGYCYKAYEKLGDGSFSLIPSAYLNLLRPMKRYPIDPINIDGAPGVIKWLLPK